MMLLANSAVLLRLRQPRQNITRFEAGMWRRRLPSTDSWSPIAHHLDERQWFVTAAGGKNGWLAASGDADSTWAVADARGWRTWLANWSALVRNPGDAPIPPVESPRACLVTKERRFGRPAIAGTPGNRPMGFSRFAQGDQAGTEAGSGRREAPRPRSSAGRREPGGWTGRAIRQQYLRRRRLRIGTNQIGRVAEWRRPFRQQYPILGRDCDLPPT